MIFLYTKKPSWKQELNSISKMQTWNADLEMQTWMITENMSVPIALVDGGSSEYYSARELGGQLLVE
jgi:hypothetical protein